MDVNRIHQHLPPASSAAQDAANQRRQIANEKAQKEFPSVEDEGNRSDAPIVGEVLPDGAFQYGPAGGRDPRFEDYFQSGQQQQQNQNPSYGEQQRAIQAYVREQNYEPVTKQSHFIDFYV